MAAMEEVGMECPGKNATQNQAKRVTNMGPRPNIFDLKLNIFDLKKTRGTMKLNSPKNGRVGYLY